MRIKLFLLLFLLVGIIFNTSYKAYGQFLNTDETYKFPALEDFFGINELRLGVSQILPYYESFYRTVFAQNEIRKICLRDKDSILTTVSLNENGFITDYSKDSVSYTFSYADNDLTVHVRMLCKDTLYAEQFFYYNKGKKTDSAVVYNYGKRNLNPQEKLGIISILVYQCEYDSSGNITKTFVKKYYTRRTSETRKDILLEDYEYCDSLNANTLPGINHLFSEDTFSLYEALYDTVIKSIDYPKGKILLCTRDKTSNVLWYHFSYDKIDIYRNVDLYNENQKDFERLKKVKIPRVQDIIITNAGGQKKRLYSNILFSENILGSTSNSRYAVFVSTQNQSMLFNKSVYNNQASEKTSGRIIYEKQSNGLLKDKSTEYISIPYSYIK